MNRRRRSTAWAMAIGLACAVLWIIPSRASDALAGLLACRELADAPARLACFDREAAAVPAAAPPREPLPGHAVPVIDPEQQFGLPERAVAAREVAAGIRAADAAKIEAHLVRLSAAPDGRLVFTLDNDQVWRQLLAEGDLLAKQGDDVSISRGLLGSFWLQIKSGRGCKVSRLR